jgi:hypothetical protein
MILMKKILLALFVVLFITRSLPAAENLYPGIPRCDIYKVKIISRGKSEELAVFQSACPAFKLGKKDMQSKDQVPLKLHAGESISWASFDLKGPVTVEVTVMNQQKVDLKPSVRVIPSRYGIIPEVKGNTVRFTMKKPGQCSVEIGSQGHRNGVMIFADPPERSAPRSIDRKYAAFSAATVADMQKIPTSKSGIYFRKGVHNIGIYEVPDRIKNIYIERGAWVDGAIKLQGNEGFKIFGRGVLSSRKLDYRAAHGIEAMNGSTHVEGIVVADFKHFALRIISENSTVKWVKTIGAWVWNMDGISVRDNSTVANCFIWANDDAIKPYRHNITFSDIVVWQLDNGGVIQMSWGNTKAKDVVIQRVDVLHTSWNVLGFNRGLLNCVGDRQHTSKTAATEIENWLIEDVVTETPIQAIIAIDPSPNGPTSIKNLRLRNWNVQMKQEKKFENKIIAKDPSRPFTGIKIENMIFNGKRVTQQNWKSVTGIRTENVSNLTVK